MTIFCWKEEALCFCVISVLGLACILDRGPVFVTGKGGGGEDWSIKPSTGNKWAKSEVILRDFEARSSTEPATFGMQASTYLESASLQKHQQLQGYNKKLFETASFIVHRKLGLIYMSIVFQHSIRIWDLYMWLFSVAKRKFCVYVWLPCIDFRLSSNICA